MDIYTLPHSSHEEGGSMLSTEDFNEARLLIRALHSNLNPLRYLNLRALNKTRAEGDDLSFSVTASSATLERVAANLRKIDVLNAPIYPRGFHSPVLPEVRLELATKAHIMADQMDSHSSAVAV